MLAPPDPCRALTPPLLDPIFCGLKDGLPWTGVENGLGTLASPTPLEEEEGVAGVRASRSVGNPVEGKKDNV